ncbi:hypothetical protein [Methanofollis sp. UBA420]|jgi:hypothetical protein|uniref:hypothetical protein n=1 Tax=Methanofollis sp. UBA420 TaxID=1915514 RepID=UPI00316ACE6B
MRPIVSFILLTLFLASICPLASAISVQAGLTLSSPISLLNLGERAPSGTGDLIPIALLPAEDGGYLLVVDAVTYLPEEDTSEALLIRAGPGGSTLWTASADASPRAAVSAPDGGWVVAGSKQRKAWAAEFADDGTLRWEMQSTLEEDSGVLKIAPASDRGFFLAGHRDTVSTVDNYTVENRRETSLWRLDTGGAPLLETSFVVSSSDAGGDVTGIADTGDTVFITTSHSLVRAGQNGTVLSAEAWPGEISALLPVDDGFVVAGTVRHTEGQVPALTKMSPEGSIIWERQYEERGAATFETLLDGPDGEIVAVGILSYDIECPPFTTYATDTLIAAFGRDGELRWQKTTGYPGMDWGSGAIATDDGYLVLTKYVTPLEEPDERYLRYFTTGTALVPVSCRR